VKKCIFLKLLCPDISLDYLNQESYSYKQQQTIDAFLLLANKSNVDGCEIICRSEIPVGAGLGSSASFSVCLAAAFLLLGGKINKNFSLVDQKTINTLALESENIFHGQTSGVMSNF
jgi:mevalonate kinase